MDTYAIIDQNGNVINTILWNGDTSTWQPPVNTTAVPISQANTSTLNTVQSTQPQYTAEDWIVKSGYTSIRLIALLDLETKLLQAGKNSNKLTAVRQWLNNLLQEYTINSQPQSNWPNPPYTFDETAQEAYNILSS